MTTDIAQVIRHAQKLADEAPPLTTDQCLLLVSVFSRYPADGEKSHAAAQRESNKRNHKP